MFSQARYVNSAPHWENTKKQPLWEPFLKILFSWDLIRLRLAIHPPVRRSPALIHIDNRSR